MCAHLVAHEASRSATTRPPLLLSQSRHRGTLVADTHGCSRSTVCCFERRTRGRGAPVLRDFGFVACFHTHRAHAQGPRSFSASLLRRHAGRTGWRETARIHVLRLAAKRGAYQILRVAAAQHLATPFTIHTHAHTASTMKLIASTSWAPPRCSATTRDTLSNKRDTRTSRRLCRSHGCGWADCSTLSSMASSSSCCSAM